MFNVFRNRRHFQFSLRTLFALMTVLCIWLGYQLHWIRERHKALAELQQPTIVFFSQTPAPWSLRWFERGVPSIVVDPDVARDAEKIGRLKRLFPEATISTPIDGLPASRSPNPGFALQAI